MPNNKKLRILAIDPGTRLMGIAVLDNEELIYHGVLTTKSRKSPHTILRECRRKILRLFKDFNPDILVIEKAFFAKSRKVALLNVLVDEIRNMAQHRKVRALGLAPSTVKKAICGNGRAGKEEVAQAVIARYPELKVYRTQDRKWKSQFHSNRFDAIALGMVGRQTL